MTIEIIMSKEAPTCEYFCMDCGQLRLSFDKTKHPKYCGNCGSPDLLVGEIEELDKELLKVKWEERRI